MTGARPAFRLAHRNLWRNKGASLLVLLLVALPAAAGSLVSITVRTGIVSAQESWVAQNGQADLAITPRNCAVCDGDRYSESPQELERNTRAAVNALPPGVSVVKSRYLASAIDVAKADRSVEVGSSKAFDGNDPLTAGMAVLQGGRWPRGADEIALSYRDLDALQAEVGDPVSVIATEYAGSAINAAPASAHVSPARIVGIVDDPTLFGPSLYVQGPDGPIRDVSRPDESRLAIGVKLPPGALVEDAKRAVDATGAAEVEVNPALESNTALRGVEDMIMAAGRWIPTGIAGFTACLGLLVIGLLARTAFAVTARRSRHDIGLAMIAGAKPRQVRLITITQGAILGLAGAAVGVAGGFAAFFLIRGWAANAMQQRLDGALEFGQSLWVVAVACVITAVLAAASVAIKEPASPAKTVADSGRPVRHRKSVGILGCLLLILGVGGLIAFITVLDSPMGPGAVGRWQLLFSLGAGGDGLAFSPWLCAAAAVLGAMLLMPRVLTLLGRIAGRLPASPRLAVRSTVRSGSRTGPVLAAVLAITSLGVAGLVTLTGSVQAERDQYLPAAPTGVVAISGDATAATGRKAELARLEHAKSAISGEAGAAELGAVDWTGLRAVAQCDAPDPQECGGANISETTATVVVRLATADTDAAAVANTLAAGGVVAFGDALSTAPGATVRVLAEASRAMTEPSRSVAPAAHAPVMTVTPREPSYFTSMHAAFISDAGIKRAAAAGIRAASPEVADRIAVLAVDRDLSRSRIDALNLGLAPYRVHLAGNAPFQDRVRGVAVLVALLIGLFAVAATVLSVALAVSEQQRDLRVLHAVGAKRRQTRNLYAIQALIVSVLAVIPGALLGGLAGVAAARFLWDGALSIPVTPLVALIIGVPLAATAVGWLWAQRANFNRDDRAWSAL